MKCVIVNPERIPAAEEKLADAFIDLINTSPDFRRRVIQKLIDKGAIKPKTK